MLLARRSQLSVYLDFVLVDCPPGFLLFGKRCFWLVDETIKLTEPTDWKKCTVNPWDHETHFASIHDAEEHGVFSVIIRR